MVINPLMGIFTWYPFSGCPWEGRPKTIYHVLTLANIEQDHLYFHGVFFFLGLRNNQATKCWKLPDFETHRYTYMHIIYHYIYIRIININLWSCPSWVELSIVLHFWLRMGKMVNMWRSIMFHFCCRMWSQALCDDDVCTVICTTCWCMMPLKISETCLFYYDRSYCEWWLEPARWFKIDSNYTGYELSRLCMPCTPANNAGKTTVCRTCFLKSIHVLSVMDIIKFCLHIPEINITSKSPKQIDIRYSRWTPH